MWFPFISGADIPDSTRDALDDIDRVIRDASHLVRGVLKTARFDVDRDGIPTDDSVRAAIQDATRAQVVFWAETGDSTGAAAQSGGGSILSVSLPAGGSASDVRSKQAARVAPAVEEILRACPGINWAVMY